MLQRLARRQNSCLQDLQRRGLVNEVVDVAVDPAYQGNGLGRKVMENNEATEAIDVSNLTAGVYFIHIATDQGLVTKNVIKE